MTPREFTVQLSARSGSSIASSGSRAPRRSVTVVVEKQGSTPSYTPRTSTNYTPRTQGSSPTMTPRTPRETPRTPRVAFADGSVPGQEEIPQQAPEQLLIPPKPAQGRRL